VWRAERREDETLSARYGVFDGLWKSTESGTKSGGVTGTKKKRGRRGGTCGYLNK